MLDTQNKYIEIKYYLDKEIHVKRLYCDIIEFYDLYRYKYCIISVSFGCDGEHVTDSVIQTKKS